MTPKTVSDAPESGGKNAGETPEGVGKAASGKTSDNAGKNASGKTSDNAGKNASGETSDNVGKSASGEMSVTGHLRELRNRIFVCLAALMVCMGAGLAFADRVVRILLSLGETYGYKFVYLSPQELLLQYVSVSFVCAVCVTLPLTLYEIWAFLRPGLKRNERVFYVLSMLSGLICAALGILFAAKALIPFMLRFLIALSRGSGAESSVSVQNYISFLLTIFVIFAVIFELPVVTVLLTQLGLLKIEWLKRARKVMIVAIFFIAAVITPPDIVSQIMVAVPLLALYELSILVCTLAARLRKPKPDASETSDASDD